MNFMQYLGFTVILYHLPIMVAWYNINRRSEWLNRLGVMGCGIFSFWVIGSVVYCFI